jgi:hypothetical protein
MLIINIIAIMAMISKLPGIPKSALVLSWSNPYMPWVTNHLADSSKSISRSGVSKFNQLSYYWSSLFYTTYTRNNNGGSPFTLLYTDNNFPIFTSILYPYIKTTGRQP